MISLIQKNGWHDKWHYNNKDEMYKNSLIKDFLKKPEKYTVEYRMSKDKEVGQIKLL